MKRLTIFGLGYVGLPTATVFASKGFNVIGVDVDKNKVEAVNSGKCYIREPGLDVFLRDTVSKGLLRATTDGVEAVRDADAVITAVPTPVEGGVADLSYLRSALEVVKRGIHKNLLIVIESTIPPGATAGFVKPFLEESGLHVEEDLYLAHVPERIAPGKAIEELLNAPRVVGGVGPRSTEKTIELYSRVNPNLLPTDATTAEFVKLAENTFRDLNIAYANLLALIAEKLGIDVYEAIRLANTHPRVNIHWPGAGVGGPCLTKDPYMLIKIAENVFGIELISIARKINEYMPHLTLKLIKKALEDNGVNITKARIAILGVAYKGGVDDVRGSPAKIMIEELRRLGAEVMVYDPYTNETFNAVRADSAEQVSEGADVLVIVTDHPEFRRLDLYRLGKLMRHRIIVDGRRVFEPSIAIERGFRYYSIGLGRAIKI
ncbi:nucleotide sugar dehydrogenase [Candidatus Bathyarchaeota archaeon]|nr:MAG: nucleotide sugar dehydrogenase [Candidatus Bathyarchaeota archaeon]